MTLLVIRLVLAALSGALVYASFPPVGWWPDAFAGLALLVLALGPVRSRRPGTGTGASGLCVLSPGAVTAGARVRRRRL